MAMNPVPWKRLSDNFRGGKMPKTVLFVCTGNSCRSVMAEGLMKRMLADCQGDDNGSHCCPVGEVEILSAGTNTFPGIQPTMEAIEVMAERGIDVSLHQGVPLTAELIAAANLILVMEARHRDHICKLAPTAQNKVYLLTYFSSSPEERNTDVADPIGLSIEEYKRCADKISNCLEGLKQEIER